MFSTLSLTIGQMHLILTTQDGICWTQISYVARGSERGNTKNVLTSSTHNPLPITIYQDGIKYSTNYKIA